MAISISIPEAASQFAELLDRVKHGEEVTILEAGIAIARFESLPIQMIHVLQVSALPNHHRDPFDRILIAQSQVEKMPILTADNLIAQYSLTSSPPKLFHATRSQI